MYLIEEDDYAQTAFPRSDSDGAVRLFWDYGEFPKQWSGQSCSSYPYEDWGEIRALATNKNYGFWSVYNIILLHFGLYKKRGIDISWEDLIYSPPELLSELSNQAEICNIYQEKNLDSRVRIIIPEFDQINSELNSYFTDHPEDLINLHSREFELLFNAIFKNQGFEVNVGPVFGNGNTDLRLIKKKSIGQLLTTMQIDRNNSKFPITLKIVAALYYIIQSGKDQKDLFVMSSSYLALDKNFENERKYRLILNISNDIEKWCKEIAT